MPSSLHRAGVRAAAWWLWGLVHRQRGPWGSGGEWPFRAGSPPRFSGDSCPESGGLQRPGRCWGLLSLGGSVRLRSHPAQPRVGGRAGVWSAEDPESQPGARLMQRPLRVSRLSPTSCSEQLPGAGGRCLLRGRRAWPGLRAWLCFCFMLCCDRQGRSHIERGGRAPRGSEGVTGICC